MTDEQIALSRRAVACKGWRWLRGMLRQDDYRYIGSGAWARWSDVHSLTTALHAPGQLPDLSDPATLGCLLALVREAGGDSKTCARPDLEDDVWYVVTRSGLAFAASEAEALVSALESAP
jgi:hypothetical protein